MAGPDPHLTAERFAALMAERAVPSVRAGVLADVSGLDAADPADAAEFLGGGPGVCATAWEETLILYQRDGSDTVEVRAVPVNRLHLEDVLTHWARLTAPAFEVVMRPSEGVALMLEAPHPAGGAIRLRLAYQEDPDERGVWAAHGVVRWLRPRS
ncbi:MAG: hypothetical protein AAFP17_06450 [Pseudomonadota bacterium]